MLVCLPFILGGISPQVNALIQTLVISEVMPNPIGDDTKNEWIEITNNTQTDVNLKEWKLNGAQLPDFVVKKDEILILIKDEASFRGNFPTTARTILFNFNLINSGGKIVLENTVNSDTYAFDYSSANEGKSFELLEGNCNLIKEHPQSHSVGLKNSSCISPTSTLLPTAIPTVIYHIPEVQSYKVEISALSPNPLSGDEWVEVTNIDSKTADLTGWLIIDSSNKKYTINGLILKQGETQRIYPGSVSLNNEGDVITLVDTNNNTVASFSYAQSNKGQIFSKSGNETQTIGEVQIINSQTEAGKEVKSESTENASKSKTDNNRHFKKPIYYKFGEYK